MVAFLLLLWLLHWRRRLLRTVQVDLYLLCYLLFISLYLFLYWTLLPLYGSGPASADNPAALVANSLDLRV
jgi:hypothetical protein